MILFDETWNEGARMKLCKDCLHMISNASPHFARCLAAPTTNPVTGDTGFNFCSIERGVGKCGPDAALFRPIKVPSEAAE